MTNEKIIEEVLRLVADDVSVTLPVNGRSMLPFITGGRDSVILYKAPSLNAVGDVVLAWVDGCRYVLHRIISIDGERITLMGDGNLKAVEHCTAGDIKAIATHVVTPDGKKHSLYLTWRRCMSRFWYRLLPVRKYLLAIYNRL